MRKLGFIICMLGVGSLWACNGQADVAILKGKLADYKNQGYLLLAGENEGKRVYDTIQVQTDGSFMHEVKGTKNSERTLYLEYLGDNRTAINCYMIPGKTTEVNITGGVQEVEQFGMKMQRYVSTPTFGEDTRKECEYLNIYPLFVYDNKFKNEDGSPVTFKNYMKQIEDKQNFLRDKLKGACAEFVEEKGKWIEDVPNDKRFIYAWRLKIDGNDASKDADFMEYINSIDINDTINLVSYDQQTTTAGNVVKFVLMANPELYKGEPEDIRQLCYIRDNITNAKVRERLGDDLMNMLMNLKGNEYLIPAFTIYRQLSSGSEKFKENETVFNSLSKLLPGVKATDFDMQDVQGQTVHFLEVIGKGKVTYIDFWATWCGPCCAEIPALEKLVKKYKDNPDIEFVSISLDKDANKWHEKLEKDQPTWKQYIIPDNFNSTFAKEYNIKAIPRFMAFDKEGKILNINAERPSDSGIDDILKKYINNK